MKKKKNKDYTSTDTPTFNLLDYKAKRFDIEQVRMAILRAKQDYGKAFEKLAKE